MMLPRTLTATLQRVLDRDGWQLGLNGLARRGADRLQFFADRPGRSPHLGIVILRTGDRPPPICWTTTAALREVAAGRVPVGSSRPADVRSFNAEVLANTPIGDEPATHYMLKFRAPQLGTVVPPQFIMMDTVPQPRAPLSGWQPDPYLKRPFGIYRCHYASLPRRLLLPPTLALAVRLPAPDHYELLYKVLPDGRGTRRMTQLQPGDTVHMLGPLGRPFDVRQLRAAGVAEVHVIGGGVGMAPLILLVEMLCYYSLPVRVFLGVQRLASIRHRDELAATFTEHRRDAYIYLDDLLAAGVPPANIHVACDQERPRGLGRGIPAANLFRGLVTNQYRAFLQQRPTASHSAATVAFACGPNRMMELVAGIGRQFGVPVRVLLEKRMGCGIGVCFSCVQRVRRAEGTVDYARVCKEGPLFAAEDIIWNDDCRPDSDTCVCAARC